MFAIPGASAFADVSLLMMRLMVAAVFGVSGFKHLRQPKERAASIGMSVPFMIFMGAAELSGTLGVAAGVLAEWAALGLSLLMLGAIYKKVVEWKTGFWGEKSIGWHYELLLISMSLVIATVGPGKLSLLG